MSNGAPIGALFIVEHDLPAAGAPIVEHRLVIHLPNDGFVYVEGSVESVQRIKKTGVVNDRHEQRNGWALVEPEAWDKLAPFEESARQWFGYASDQKIATHAPLQRRHESPRPLHPVQQRP